MKIRIEKWNKETNAIQASARANRNLKRKPFLLNWSNQVLDRKRRTGVQKQAEQPSSRHGLHRHQLTSTQMNTYMRFQILESVLITTTIKTPVEGVSFERTAFISPTQFQGLLASFLRCIEAVVVVHSDPNTLTLLKEILSPICTVCFHVFETVKAQMMLCCSGIWG